SDLSTWLNGIASVLKKPGFREPTQSELASMHLNSPDDVRNMIVKNSPFGMRDDMKKAMGSFVFLIDDEFDSCVQVAEIIVTDPVEGAKEDYGAIAITTMGLGNCFRAQRTSATLSDALLATATRYLRNEVKNR